MKARVAVLPGDGIGPEVTGEARRCLEAVARRFGHQFVLEEAPVGAAAIDACGEPLPAATLALARGADAVLFGAIGDPRFNDPSLRVRPEQAILGLRAELGLYANLRPAVPHPSLRRASPLKDELLAGVDLLVVRELTGGIYFGRRTRDADSATDECRYTVGEIERIARVAGRLARGRRRRVTSVDKANVLETSRLWRQVVTGIFAAEFPDCNLEHQLVDSAAMLLLARPAYYDVLVTENLFGDILSDETAALAGSLGLLPSASLGDGPRGLYEPIHGSAPDIANRGIANPYGAIGSAALLLRHSLGLEAEASALEKAIHQSIGGGVLTADLSPRGTQAATTREAGQAVLDRL
ncbi:MAG: 3-isopropylmalate dehydrogenase [Gammaproteobacteria bacterium]|nr:MAG: 3-isopropylmalate dehydrogenase [Gammaproteobacteria bacterium]